MSLDAKARKEKRAQAHHLQVTLHLGKAGLTDEAVAELKAQLGRRHLVKVRLLPSATESATDREQAEALAERTGAELIDVRGHTAVLWKA